MKKHLYWFFLICNIVFWGYVILSDCIEEYLNGGYETGLMWVAAFGLPALTVGLYIWKVIREQRTAVSVLQKIKDKLVWAGISSVFAVPICCLVLNDQWPIEQHDTGWLSLNGIEYLLVAVCFAGGSLVCFILFDIGNGIYRWVKTRKENGADSKR